MRFEPKSEDQIQAESLLPKGEYDFEVMAGADKVSKSGNEMIVLKVKVFGLDGDEYHIWDYLTEALPHKLRHAADACRILDKYESGQLLARDFEGRTGKCFVDIQSAQNGYAAKNVIKDYVKRSDKVELSPSLAKQKNDLNDEIPF